MAEKTVDQVMGESYNESNYSAVTAVHSGLRYQELGAYPGRVHLVRMQHSVERAFGAVGGGRIYQDSTDEDNEFSITALVVLYRGTLVTIAAAVNQALSGGDVAHYIYADPVAGAWVVSDVGWPATPHVRIGVITLSSGAWDWNSLVDHRHGQALQTAEPYAGGTIERRDLTTDTVLTSADSGKLLTNAGATDAVLVTLPTPPAAPRTMVIEVFVAAAQYLKIQAGAGHTIRNLATASAAAGYIRANTIGNSLRLMNVSDTTWAVIGGAGGTWTIDS